MNGVWSDYTRRLIGLLLLIVIALLLWVARSVISTLLIASVIAFLIEPLVRGLNTRLRMPRILAGILVLLVLLLLFALLVAVLAPILVDQFTLVSFNVTDSVSGVLGWLRDTSEDLRVFRLFGYRIVLNTYVDAFQEKLDLSQLDELLPSGENIFGSVGGILVTGAGTLAAFTLGLGQLLLTLFLIVIFTLYLVNDGPRLGESLGRLLPEPQRTEFGELKTQITRVWKAYFRGQLLLVSLFGLMVGVVMWALGLPSALIVGILSAVMDLVPTVGALVAGSLAVFMALIQGSEHLGVNNFVFAGIVLGSYLGLQQVESSILQPRIMGRSVELPGIFIIVGVTVGATVAGVLGAYLAVPVMATARLIFLYIVSKLREEPDTPDGPSPEQSGVCPPIAEGIGPPESPASRPDLAESDEPAESGGSPEDTAREGK